MGDPVDVLGVGRAESIQIRQIICAGRAPAAGARRCSRRRLSPPASVAPLSSGLCSFTAPRRGPLPLDRRRGATVRRAGADMFKELPELPCGPRRPTTREPVGCTSQADALGGDQGGGQAWWGSKAAVPSVAAAQVPLPGNNSCLTDCAHPARRPRFVAALPRPVVVKWRRLSAAGLFGPAPDTCAPSSIAAAVW